MKAVCWLYEEDLTPVFCPRWRKPSPKNCFLPPLSSKKPVVITMRDIPALTGTLEPPAGVRLIDT